MRSFAVLPLILAVAFAGQDQTQSQLRRRNLQEEPQRPFYSYEEGRWIMPPPVVNVDFNPDPDWEPDLGEEADFSTNLVVVPPEDEPVELPPPTTADEVVEEEEIVVVPPEDEPIEPPPPTTADEVVEEEEIFEEEGGEEEEPREPPVVNVDIRFTDAPSMLPSDAPSMVPSDAPSMVPSDAPSSVPV